MVPRILFAKIILGIKQNTQRHSHIPVFWRILLTYSGNEV